MPTNDCEVEMGVLPRAGLSVFACMCCSASIGAIALVLALVARVFHPDPANSVKAVTLNRFAFRFAISAILIGITTLVVIGILYGSMLGAMVGMFQNMLKKQDQKNDSPYKSNYN